MIAFDLRCDGGHVFEAWFGSSRAYEEQRDRGLVACPVCGSGSVEKAVMAPNVAPKGNRASAVAGPEQARAEQVRAMIAAIAAAQAEALKQSRWVGGRFAEEARAIHDAGSAETIHGRASAEEARALAEDGVAVLPLLVPVVPPDEVN